MAAPRPRSWQPRQLDAGIFQAEISSFAPALTGGGWPDVAFSPRHAEKGGGTA